MRLQYSPSIFLGLHKHFSKWKDERIERQFSLMSGLSSACPLLFPLSWHAQGCAFQAGALKVVGQRKIKKMARG
ncbi:MAG: hypothetical protein WBM99_15255, partial [Psychromonas sp.]